MESSVPIAENVKVVLRVRPRVDALPAHPSHYLATHNAMHDPDCVKYTGKHQITLLPPSHCRCDACFNKVLNVNTVAEKFGTPGGRERKEKIFRFETILGPDSSQEDVYSTVADTVYSSVLGFNATIFAYGSMGSGKTYTMTGTRNQPGVIPRVIEDIFRGIQHSKSLSKDVMFHVELSYVEMYNNGFRNLLRQVSDEVTRVESMNGNSDMLHSELDELLQAGVSEAAFEAGVSKFVDLSHKLDKITVHESVSTGVYLCGPNIRIPVKSPSGALRLFAIGNKQRSETLKRLNDRSHAVLTIHVESKVTLREGRSELTQDDPELTSSSPNQEKKSGRDTPTVHVVRSELRLGKIHLVDLAGSERLSETKAEGEAMTETQNINKSLLALGEVLHALALNASIQLKNVRKRSLGGDATARPRGISFASAAETAPAVGEMHVPYLNSKLTHLLKDSLGGNSKTIMITNVGCEVEQYHHILHSLNYASRAMKVRNLVHPIRVEIGDSEYLPDLSNERDVINQLKERLFNRGPNGRERPLPRYPSVGKSSPAPASQSSNGSVTARGPSPARGGSSGASVATFNSAGNQSGRPRTASASSPSPGRPNRLPGQKSYTLKLDSIQAQQLNYVSFPLCPVLKFRVDKQEAATSKNLYSRAVANFPESFEFEVGALKYKAGTDLEVQAVNISPLTGELIPIGEGRVDVQEALPALNARETVTIELLNAAMQPAGLVVIGAVLLSRPVNSTVSYPGSGLPSSSQQGPKTPFSPSASQGAQLDFNPTARTSDVKNGVFRVDRIVCHDLSLPTAARPTGNRFEPPKSELFVVVQVGNQSLRTEPASGKLKQSNVFATFDRPNMSFDVDYDLLPTDTLHVAVFEVPAGSKQSKECVGRAKAPLFTLVGRNDGVYTPATEFAMQLNDDNNAPVGTVSLFLLFSKSEPSLQIDTAARNLFDSPGKGATSPTKHLRSIGMSPRLNNVRVPSGFHTGWIRISSIVATNLNKFRLVGNTARYKHLRDAPMTPVPAYLKHSELFGKQDPFVVVEAGEFWGSYSKVLLNQGWNCQWDQAAFCCYLSQVEASEQNMRVSVYDRSCSGFHNVFIGFASVPLINLFAAQRTTEASVELNVVDRRGKLNGKLELKYTWEASDEKERWSNGIVTKVCGDGCYDIRYDDGEEEFAVFKDVIRLIARSKQMLPPKQGGKFDFGADIFFIEEGSKVEVNDQGRGLWFPAVVARNNRDGTYDLECDYDIVTAGVSADNIRTVENQSPPGPVRTGSFSKRLNFDESVGSVAGGRKNKFKLRDVVEGNYKCKGTWYVGKIFKVHTYEQYCTYDIDYLTGEYESEVAEDMIRLESTRYTPDDATSAYELRTLRSQRPESNVVIPLHRTGAFAGMDSGAAAKARGLSDAERTKSKYQAGEEVEVNYRGHGVFYLGTVEVDYENGLYDILYESGERDIDVPEDLVRTPEEREDDVSPEEKLQLANSQSRMYKFEVGDRVEANFREIGKYIPGIITRDRGHGVFDVQYYDGRNETKVNFELIRLADPNAYFAPPKRAAKYAVGQSVECNCERLGIWYHALIRNVVDSGVYNIQYDDGETEYDVAEDMLRKGGAYSPGIPSLKPFFKVGDRVKVACRSHDVEHELRSLSAIKQRIMEERKKLAEGKLVVAKRTAMQDSVNNAVAAAHRGMQGFKTRVGYSGDLNCCQAEKKDGVDEESPLSSTGVSPTSFKKLDEIETAFNNPTSAGADGASEADPVETLNDAITKAIVVEQSLGHLARAAKEEELAKAHSAYLLSIAEKDKADELALARAMDEAKARKRNNFSRDEELKAFREAYQKAELELGHIMAARQLVLEQDEALKMAKQKADLEAKCIIGAQRKGEKASARLREEDRLRLAQGEFKDGRSGQQGKQPKKKEASSRLAQQSLGRDVARDRDALRVALLRVKEFDEELNDAKSRAEQAGRDYAAADTLAQAALKELQTVLDGNRQAEHTLTEDSTLTPEFREYLSAADAITSYRTQASSKCAQKLSDVHKAEKATSQRMRKEEDAAVAAAKRTSAEESIILSARNGEMEDAKSAMREANMYAVQQGDDVVAATAASEAEAAALVTAKAFAIEERKVYASARDLAVLAAGLLRVIIADQREREYRGLEDAKAAAQAMAAELESVRQVIADRDLRRVNTTAAAQTEALAIAQFRARVAHLKLTSSSAATMEKTTLSLKIMKAQNGRMSAEGDIQRLSHERMALEEKARVAAKKCEIEESVAEACAQDDAVRDTPTDKFNDPVKREQLHHFSTYSAEECKAVRVATAHANDHFAALQEAKACALAQVETIDTCRAFVQEEFGHLSSLSVVERDELRALLPSTSLSELQQQLAACKVRAMDANRALFIAKQKAAERSKELASSKESTNDVLEELAQVQATTQGISPRDFSIDRTKVSVVEGAQLAVRDALDKAVAAEQSRHAAEADADEMFRNAEESARHASSSERLRCREEETSRRAVLENDGIGMDSEDQQLALLAALTHTEAQIALLNEATASVDREAENLVSARVHSVDEGKAIHLALAKEETIVMVKAEWEQQKADADLTVAKKLLDGRMAIMLDSQNTLERHALALDVMVATLERAAKELVARGDDDIDEFRAYQKEFKRFECKKQKANDARKRKENKLNKAELAGKARDAEEEGAIATDDQIYKLERTAALAEQNGDPAAEVKALREGTKLCKESTIALAAAKEYAVAEEELCCEAQEEADEERRALSAARDHAEEAWRLLVKALSVLPLKHRSPMGLLLLNGGDGFFKGDAVRPRKKENGKNNGGKRYDPSLFADLASDGDDVNGNKTLRAADFKADVELPDKDSKELNFQFEANPRKAALRASQDDLDRVKDFLNAAKQSTEDAERKYRAANAAATAEGDAVGAQEDANAATTRRLYDNFAGVEAERAQLQKVRSDLNYEDKCTANLRSAKEGDVKKVDPFAENRKRCEEAADGHAENMAKALANVSQASRQKDGPALDRALAEAKKHCDLQVGALNEAAQSAAKECSAWGNGTAAANKERGSAEKAHALADEEARLLALIRAAQLSQGQDMYRAACKEAEAARDHYEEKYHGMDGFAELVDGLKLGNDEREAELSEETQATPAYRAYKEVRAKFEAERKRAQAAHVLHDIEVGKALAARAEKEDDGVKAEGLEAKRLVVEAGADDAHADGDKAEEARLAEEAKQLESGVGAAYQHGTCSANTETAAWDAAGLHLDSEKEALTAAHSESLEATALLVQLRSEQIARELLSLRDAKQLALDCANAYDAANKRAAQAATALTRSRTLLAAREAVLAEDLKKIPDYSTYLDLIDAATNSDEQANEFQQEKLPERALVDVAMAAKLQDEKIASAAGTQRAVAEAAVRDAQSRDDMDAERHAMEDLKKFSDDEEAALLSAKQRAAEEAHHWGIATDFANEEATSRIIAKDNTNEALRLLNAIRLDKERSELEAKKAEAAEAEQTYRNLRKAVADAKAKTPALVEASKMPPGSVDADVESNPEYDRYLHKASTVAADAKRPVIDHDIVNASEIARAKAAGQSRAREEQAAGKCGESRAASDKTAMDLQKRGELEKESKAVDEVNAHVDAEEKSVLAATRFAQDELTIWKNLKQLSENELKAANGLNERAEEAARMLKDLLLSEKGRLAEACGVAIDEAAAMGNEYVVTNKKTLARNATLLNNIARSEALAKSTPLDCQQTAEYLAYERWLPENAPLDQQAQAVKKEKDETVVEAEAAKAKRVALEQACHANHRSPARTNSVKDLINKFEWTGGALAKRAAEFSQSSVEMLTALLAIAKEECALWSKATASTIQEKEAYTASNVLFEEGMLLQAAAVSNQHERDILASLTTAEAAANSAKDAFYMVCKKLEEQEAELEELLHTKDVVQGEVQSADPQIVASVAFVRVQDKLTSEQTRIATSKANKDAVVVKALALVEARLAEESVAADCATKFRRVVVGDSAAKGSSSLPSAALPRVDKVICAVQIKTRPAAAEDVPDAAAGPVAMAISEGDHVSFKSLRDSFPDFGAAKREKSEESPGMAALAAEQVTAEKEELALVTATHHAVDEEQTWRLALQHANAESDALAKAAAAAAEAAKVLKGLADDSNAQEAAALDAACADAAAGSDLYAKLNGECADLGREFEEKKATIGAKDAEINGESKETADYRQFMVLNGELSDVDEPAILAARAAKLAAAERAAQASAKKDSELANAATAGRAKREADVKRARGNALDAATEEAAAWAEANRFAETEAGLLKPGIAKEDKAIKLLHGVKEAQVKRDSDALGAAEADAQAEKDRSGEVFDDAERKHIIYGQEKAKMTAKEAELLPETKSTPTYRKFEKLKTELADEDDPFIFSKRDARIDAAQEAEALVIANRREKPTVQGAEGEKAAWMKAGDLAREEVGGLDTGIDKAKQAQDLLAQAKLDELNQQSGEGAAGLNDAKRRAADSAAALKDLEEKIAATRAKLAKLQEENEENAEAVRGKGPEFAGSIAAHKQTLASIGAAVSNAEEHREGKEASKAKAGEARTAAEQAEDALAKGTPLSDPEDEAARRRDALVAANENAQAECEHLSSATSSAQAELDALLKAQTAAQADNDTLSEASTARAYRTRMGYLLMGGDEDLIPIPKSKPFNSAPMNSEKKVFLDAKKMTRPKNHEAEEATAPKRKALACSEVECDSFGDDSRAPKVLFQVGGGWATTLASQVKKIPPYLPPEHEEYMPARAVVKAAAVAGNTARTRTKTKKAVAPSSFYEKSDGGEVTTHKLRGKALFIAVVRHLMSLGRVVRTLKPLQEGELDTLKEKISESGKTAENSSQFLTDNLVMQSKAGRALQVEEDEDAPPAISSLRTESYDHEHATRHISSNIDAFLSDLDKKDTMIEYETSTATTKITSTAVTGKAFDFAAAAKLKTMTVQKKTAQTARISKHAGTDVTHFKERKHVDVGSISSLLFGGMTSSVDVAVLDEEEDVIETVKETTSNTTRSEEKSEQHSTEETHTEETEVLQTMTVTAAVGSAVPLISAAPAKENSSRAAKGPVKMSDYAEDEADDFGTAFEDDYDPHSHDAHDQFPGPSESTRLDSEPSPIRGESNSSKGRPVSSRMEGGESSSGKQKKMKKVGSSQSVSSVGSRSLGSQSGGSSKRKPDSSLMAEMMSGNIDL